MNDEAWVRWINDLEPLFKKKWMNNGIYELIMLSKTIVVANPELLTTVILFWNSGTNTFDFRMGLMSPTILDMAQVFGLRQSGRIVDVTHDWVPPSLLVVEISGTSPGTSTSLLLLEYNSRNLQELWYIIQGFHPFCEGQIWSGFL